MNTKVIEWTDLAIQDLDIIYNYISKDSVNNASIFIDELIKNIDNLVKFPNQGRVIPQVKKDYYREIFVGNYRVMYKLEENYIYILAVINMSINFNLEMLKIR